MIKQEFLSDKTVIWVDTREENRDYFAVVPSNANSGRLNPFGLAMGS